MALKVTNLLKTVDTIEEELERGPKCLKNTIDFINTELEEYMCNKSASTMAKPGDFIYCIKVCPFQQSTNLRPIFS